MLLNLQEWLSPQGRVMLSYKPEEIMTTDAVIVAPKPILKEPEENRDIASVTHLEFTQCQTSYVGLPGIHEASQPVPVVCSGDTSYTQLPCSVWGVSFVPSPPEDFLNISHADSGCSFAESCWWKSTMWWLQRSQQNSRRCCSCFSVQMKLPKFFIWHPARRLRVKNRKLSVWLVWRKFTGLITLITKAV